MSWWVKRTGQFLIAVLFLISCEEDSFLLGFQKNKKFNVRYQELSFESSVLVVDSVITDNRGTPSRFLVGRYVDDMLGEVQSEAYTEFYPTTRTLIDAASTFDSITVQLRFDTYVYGASGVTNEEISIHEVVEPFNEAIFTDSLNFRYYYNSSIAYNPTPIVSNSIEVEYDSLIANRGLSETSQDTILFTFKIDNANPFGIRLFDFVRTNAADDDLTFRDEFLDEFNGLAFIPGPTNSKVVGINPFSTLSKLTLHYHTTADTLVRNFTFSSLSFNRITTDRSASELAGLPTYQEFEVGNFGYVQAGSPVITKLNLSDFYSFTDTIPRLEINSAELIITPQGVIDGLEPPSILVRLQNDDNQFTNTRVEVDRERMTGYARYYFDGYYYTAGSEFSAVSSPSALILSYDDDNNEYSGFATLFFQDLFDNREKTDKILYMSLNALSSSIGKTVNRVVFNKNTVKLKIHYTKPVSSNP